MSILTLRQPTIEAVDANTRITGQVYTLPYFVDKDGETKVLCFRKILGKWYCRHRHGHPEGGRPSNTKSAPNGKEYVIYPNRYKFPPLTKEIQMKQKGIGKLCLAGGRMLYNEPLLAAALRELHEQTGLVLDQYPHFPVKVRRILPRCYCLYVEIANANAWLQLITGAVRALLEADMYGQQITSERVLLRHSPPVEDNELGEVHVLSAVDLVSDCLRDENRNMYAKCAALLIEASV